MNMACGGNKNNKYFYKNSVKDRMDKRDKAVSRYENQKKMTEDESNRKAINLEKSNKEVSKEDESTAANTKQYNKTPIKISSETLKKKIKDIL